MQDAACCALRPRDHRLNSVSDRPTQHHAAGVKHVAQCRHDAPQALAHGIGHQLRACVASFKTDNVSFASYLMAMALAIVAYLFTQRWVMEGVTQGAVKG